MHSAIHFFQMFVLTGFFFSFIILTWHYLFHFAQIKTQKAEKAQSHQEPVSVIICARNESQNLAKHIPAFCQQDYPHFEVIVVNDRSTDDSSSILAQLKERYQNLRVLEHQSVEASGKKAALRFGIQNAQHEIILLSDADCQPRSNKWVEQMAATFDEETDLVLGFGAYEKTKGILNNFVQYETYLTALQYFAWAKSGLAYMGVGRNLAYRKSAFLQTDQFSSTQNLASGDDDLLVQQIANRSNTKSVWLSAANTLSKAPETFDQWKRQKIRHLSTGTHYRKEVQFRLSLFSVSNILFYLMGTIALISSLLNGQTRVALVVAAFFALHWLVIVYCNRSKPQSLQLSSSARVPFYDLLYCIYLLSFSPFLFYKPNAHTWNKKWIDSYS